MKGERKRLICGKCDGELCDLIGLDDEDNWAIDPNNTNWKDPVKHGEPPVIPCPNCGHENPIKSKTP